MRQLGTIWPASERKEWDSEGVPTVGAALGLATFVHRN